MFKRSYVTFSFTALAIAIGYNVRSTYVEDRPTSEIRSIHLVAIGSNAFSNAVALGAESAARELNVGLTFEHQATPGEAASSPPLSNHMATDVMLLSLGRGVPLPPFIEGLDSEAKLLTCGTGASPRRGWGHVGVSDFATGFRCGSYLVQLEPRGGTVIILADHQEERQTIDRIAGLQWVARAGGVPLELVVCDEDGGKRETCLRTAHEAMLAHPRAMCVVDLSDRQTDSVVSDLCELLTHSDARLITFEQSDAALAGVEAGEVTCVIADNPYALGRGAVQLLTHIGNASEMGLPAPGRALINVPQIILDASNVSEYRRHQGPGWTCTAGGDILLNLP